MEGFKEFQAKNLDSAIEEACNYFNAIREKLEIEIVEDAKSGIFGIVGARKAKVRARRVAPLREAVQNILDKKAVEEKTAARDDEDETETAQKPQPRPAQKPPTAKQHKPAPKRKKQEAPAETAPAEASFADEDIDEDAEPATPVKNLDSKQLEALINEAVRELTRPIVGQVQTTVTVEADRVRVAIGSNEDSGLLIGREGQTLLALQYMLSRIVSRGMNASVRVQLDAGDYRRRQDEKLRETALSLAKKTRQTGRSWSTRPLSSYHRRIIHLTLQEVADIQTRSTGEGPMKRVVVMRAKNDR
ncbi:MAG: Jag N-terminal domain-containing protein [Desulfovibrio sp.]|jgi:spoIIIJ-associated protein|nr:Jag N-terminal domain-containing protein [Desulfovibrio sp.]